ncbi:MAG: hypothetical protein ACKO1U_07875, partial [Bacteroidota bacterium]
MYRLRNHSFAYWLRITLALSALALFTECGSDKAGDEIGSSDITRYPQDYTVKSTDVYVAPGLNGPQDISSFSPPTPLSWTAYRQGERSRMAILLTDTNSAWLGLVHALKTIGVPFLITDDYRQAIQHKVVLAYPVISGAALSPEALSALAAFPREGGT